MKFDDDSVCRGRLRQVFTFLKALDEHRNPVKRQLAQQPRRLPLTELPNHPDVELVYPTEEAADSGDPPERTGYILRVRRPVLTNSPEPPVEHREWIEGDWKNPKENIHFLPRRQRTDPPGNVENADFETFEAVPERVEVLTRWKISRDQWAAKERPARDAMDLFNRLDSLRGHLGRVSDEEELVFGDGLLNWRLASGGLHHPILLQRVELEFDSMKPEFRIVEGESPVELYSALLRTAEEVDGGTLAGIREEMEAGGISPLLGRVTSTFLKGVVPRLSAQGEFLDAPPPPGEEDRPRVWREPVLFLRKRSLGFAAAIAAVLEDLDSRGEIPAPLSRVVGCETGNSDAPEQSAPLPSIWSEPADILLSREANPEQIRVADRLGRSSSVVVQGPPGTGKTHTIANLIGHLLAQGKSVLVTSHTGKALTVLRDKVAEPLQSLCISLLGDDIDSRRQLEQSINGMVERLSTSDPEELDRRARQLEDRRNQLRKEVDHCRQRVIESRKGEYRPVIVAGRSLEPAQAAREVAANRSAHAWLPGPLAPGAPPPLSVAELTELYRSNELLPVEDESELLQQRPSSSELPRPHDVRAFVEQWESVRAAEREFGREYWNRPIQASEEEQLSALTDALQSVADQLHDAERWWQRLVQVGLEGGTRREAWYRLLEEVQELQRRLEAAHELRLRFSPELPTSPLEDQLEVVTRIADHVEARGQVRWSDRALHPSWKRFIDEARVNGAPPSRREHFAALRTLIWTRLQTRQLEPWWKQLAEPAGLPTIDFSDPNADRALPQLSAAAHEALKWTDAIWKPLQERIEGLGFSWGRIAGETKIRLVETPHFDRLQEQLAQLEPIVKARSSAALWTRLEKHRREVQAAGARLRALDQPARISGTLSQTLENLSVDGYELAFGYLKRLEGLEAILSRRSELLERLASAAPAWAEAIRPRRGVHGKLSLPGEPEAAWCWRQMDEELDRRGAESLSDLQRQIEEKSRELRRVTAELIEQKAWGEQVRRIDLDTRLALGGWRDLIRQTPKTSIVRGKLARLRRARQDAMRRSRFAVPVWIMPLNRVVENFDFASTHFDVVIIDEASQMDVSGLLPYYLAQKVLVVGDHEQVSPSAVGQKGDVVENLIREHLQGIPNADLYNGQTSIYDLARHSSEGHTCLVEHFRSVPEIIQFSNDLCYRGQIQPLRDPTTSRVRPAVIPYRVEGPFDGTRPRVNDVEALAVASLIVACSEQPEYRELTMGVVSMVGDEQAIEIERLLRTHLAVDEYERHQLVCGNSAQFQGDERDVMFLSLVDRPGDGPLRFRGDTPSRQRFNVAASRARDQTWVAFAVDPDHDLQAEDLRKRLIDHSRDPRALVRKLDRVEKETESEFERQVARRLVQRGFRVRPQFRIGYYRIDLVVEGTSGKRLAVECDGARWHPIEKLGEDMARQATLERLGWTFARVRGTEFFRDPDRAMDRVFAELDRLGIVPAPDDQDQEREAEEHAHDDALIKRVIQRAAELRRKWAGSNEEGMVTVQISSSPASEEGSAPEATTTYSRIDQPEVPMVATQQEPARVLDFGRSGPAAGKEAPVLRPKSSVLALPRTTSDEEDEPPGSSVDYRSRLPQTEAEIWYAISHWAKASDQFRSWERRLVYDIGRYLQRGWRITARQAEHAVRLFEEAFAGGFRAEDTAVTERAKPASKPAKKSGGRWDRIADVPQASIRRAIWASLPPVGQRIDREDLLRGARGRLGFGSLKRSIRSRLNRCIGAWIRSGKLESQGDEVWRTR